MTKFTEEQIKELEAKGCEFLTPLQGNKGNIYFKNDNKLGLIIDHYVMKNGKIVNIITKENQTFEELINKL